MVQVLWMTSLLKTVTLRYNRLLVPALLPPGAGLSMLRQYDMERNSLPVRLPLIPRYHNRYISE